MSTAQIIYICISPIVVALVVFLGTLIKKQKAKDGYLFFWAFVCFFIHISTMYVSFFENKDGNTGFAWDNQLFPIYFCNLVMYLLLIVSVWPDKSTKLYQNIATFTAWGGIFGGLITLFAQDVDVHNWYNFQSSLSHSCLLIGSLYLFAGKYIKLNVYNLVPYTFGLLGTGVVGGIVELIFFLAGRPSPNSMYLVHGPVEMPAMHGGYFALAMIAIIFVITVLFEQFTRKDESTRWYKTTNDLWMYLPKRTIKENKQ